MAGNMVATEKVSDGNSSPVQPSQPAPRVAAVASPSDPNLASINLWGQARDVVYLS